MTGEMRIAAKGTNLPDKNRTPTTSSVALTKFNKYPEAAIPSLNVFISPVNSGFGNKSAKYATEPKINKAPINVRTITTAIFMLTSNEFYFYCILFLLFFLQYDLIFVTPCFRMFTPYKLF